MEDILNFKRSEEEDYYKILGCDELSSTEQITAEYKARVLDCHPDKHPNDPEAAKRFELIQTAKDVLCDGEKRPNYDKWRCSGMAVSYRKWCSMRDAVHTSMHWASPKKETMLESGPSRETTPQGVQADRDRVEIDQAFITKATQSSGKSHVPWQQDTGSEMLRKFRNYEI